MVVVWSTVSRQENKEMFDLEKLPDKNRRKVSLGESPRLGPYQHILFRTSKSEFEKTKDFIKIEKNFALPPTAV